jgi:hypothetical protein
MPTSQPPNCDQNPPVSGVVSNFFRDGLASAFTKMELVQLV